MKAYVRLDGAGVAAFFFTRRERDYGGIHLGVPKTEALLALVDELSRANPGHSRRVPVLPVPEDLPRSIVRGNVHQSLVSLRIGTSTVLTTRIQIENKAGIVMLSPRGLAEFNQAIALVHGSHGDLLVAGDSGLWTDRLWLWPFA